MCQIGFHLNTSLHNNLNHTIYAWKAEVSADWTACRLLGGVYLHLTSHRAGCRFKGTRKISLVTLLIPVKWASKTSRSYL